MDTFGVFVVFKEGNVYHLHSFVVFGDLLKYARGSKMVFQPLLKLEF